MQEYVVGCRNMQGRIGMSKMSLSLKFGGLELWGSGNLGISGWGGFRN